MEKLGLIPVSVFDAPLFMLAKLVQRKWPDTYGHDGWFACARNGCQSVWTTALIASDACLQLVKCTSKSENIVRELLANPGINS